MDKITTAIAHCSKFHCPHAANRWRLGQKYFTQILMGCDGRWWVPSTHRECGRLTKAGYERFDYYGVFAES